jgi:hypothetical protein
MAAWRSKYVIAADVRVLRGKRTSDPAVEAPHCRRGAAVRAGPASLVSPLRSTACQFRLALFRCSQINPPIVAVVFRFRVPLLLA